MNHTTAIKDMMSRSKLTQSRLGNLLGIKRAALGLSISSRNIGIIRLIKITEACGYELVLQPATQGKRREGQMVLRSADYTESEGND